jgi:amino acid adenylation domain-containing protein
LSASHLCDYLEASASRHAEHEAVADPSGATLTYRELDERANRVAGFLLEQGVRPGDRVGIVLPKTINAFTILFGVMKARAAYVPVDYSSPIERIRTILTDCQVSAVFLDPRCLEVAGVCATVVVVGDEKADCAPGAFRWNAVLEHSPAMPDAASRNSDELAYILYTSGSTGIPKGVMLTHRNAIGYVDWCSEVFNPSEHDRFSSHAPFHFDLSILDIYVPIKHGARVDLIPDDLGKNPRELAAFIADHRITVWYSTPAILSLLAEFGQLSKFDYSFLRLVLFAGEVFPVKQLRKLVAQWPSPSYYNLYGPTETNVCTYAAIPTPIPESRTEPFPIGWTCSHCKALVLSTEDQPVSPGEDGLLFISGSPVFSGYWARPVETAAVFIERYGDRWYNTGDVVREDSKDGFIYVGRRDRMVKRRGYRIELDEIGTALYRHPAIQDAAVISAPHPESGVRIICFLVASESSRPSILELKTFCGKHLPSYMNPDVFIFLESLPRTSTNKTNYQALIQEFQAREQETASGTSRT